ncbi:MAG: right-handed parallel beta-helix repeat-containing protein [Akkermansiaceae bacterium]|nr:right-handed parallel beta-helix repeat-containing protein [Akkermansiaceae bacterium]
MKILTTLLWITGAPTLLIGAELHVAVNGDDTHDGAPSKPLKTISAAAKVAQPGDVITVHAGVYRERVSPPRGGESADKRIVYQAAAGEKVVITGSEIIKGWEKADNDTWKVTIPNSFFGEFNPYSDLIRGDWFNAKGRDHHTGAVYLDGHWLTEAAKLEEVLKPAGTTPLWSCRVDANNTTIWAQFKNTDPNKATVEINVRRTVFTPEKTGINYITVRGFDLRNAATNWAPPSAGQFGIVSAYWNKGWIIEDNEVSYSKCTGIALGKYGDEFDNTNKKGLADPYTECVRRALKNGWNKESVGSHTVRNNHIHHCEQAGIVGSLGAAFSTIVGNEVHDIHVQRLFSGAEMAGIKLHAAIDVLIRGNHIHHTVRGLWLDWMAQGTRVTANLFHHNGPSQDLFVEVNHGPFLVDNNMLLSSASLLDLSEGGAYAHNIIAGSINVRIGEGRATPYHHPHSTAFKGVAIIDGGDIRFYNNIFGSRANVALYDPAPQPVNMAGNVFLKGAKPSKHESAPLVLPKFDPAIKLLTKADGHYLEITLDKSWATGRTRRLVTTELLGKVRLADVPFVQPDSSPYRLDTDYLGNKRQENNPFPGPFEISADGKQSIKVWPLAKPVSPATGDH